MSSSNLRKISLLLQDGERNVSFSAECRSIDEFISVVNTVDTLISDERSRYVCIPDELADDPDVNALTEYLKKKHPDVIEPAQEQAEETKVIDLPGAKGYYSDEPVDRMKAMEVIRDMEERNRFVPIHCPDCGNSFSLFCEVTKGSEVMLPILRHIHADGYYVCELKELIDLFHQSSIVVPNFDDKEELAKHIMGVLSNHDIACTVNLTQIFKPERIIKFDFKDSEIHFLCPCDREFTLGDGRGHNGSCPFCNHPLEEELETRDGRQFIVDTCAHCRYKEHRPVEPEINE